MTVYTKISMADIWASSGEVTKPDSAKIASGWAIEIVPRQWWNWFENRQDNNIAYLFQRGFAEWDAETEYLANNSYVLYNGLVYKCILGNTNQLPTDPTYWDIAFITPNAATKALAAVTPAADKLPYFTSTTAATTTTLSAFARTILDDADAAAVRATIGAQASDPTLTAFANVTTGINLLPYFNGTDSVVTTLLTVFGRSLLANANNAEARTTLGLGTISTQDAHAVAISGGSITGITDLAIADGGTGASTAAGARTNLGLGTAATSPVQTSFSDSTAGAVLTVGAFGLGGTDGILLGTADLDTVTRVGMYGQTANVEATLVRNYPVTQAGTLLVERAGGSIITQKYTVYNTGETYFRAAYNLAWSAWRKVYDSANISSASIAATQLTGTIDDARLPATISSSITGNAATATKLATARTINGVSFDGTANITIADSTKLPTTGGTITGILTSTVGGEAIQVRGTTTGVASTAFMSFEQSNGTRDGYIGVSSNTNTNMIIVADTGEVQLYPVAGDVFLYSSGVQKAQTTSAGFVVTGTCSAGTFSGSGASLTSLNADNIASGVLDVARGGTGVTTSTGTGNNVLSASPAFSGTPTAPTAAIGTNTTQIATTAFARGVLSAATSGYQELPSGLVIQWGRAASAIGINGSANFTFPVAFAAVYSLSVTGKTASATDGASVNYTALSTTGFTASNGSGDGSTTEISWIAIGV